MEKALTLGGEFNVKDLQCIGCGGWPIDNGSVFVPVFLVKDGKNILGGICELCWLRRLEKRGHIVNATSSPCSQVHIPSLGLRKTKR